MNLETFKNKKIGIWGYGKVGASYLLCIEKYTTSITIMDKKLPSENFAPHIQLLLQTPENIESFLNSHEYILVSPGVNTSAYEKHNHKFITELDIFTTLWKKPIIAITGTLGKTTITSLSAQLLQKYGLHAQAIGNIGYPMLECALNQESTQIAVLELSSFQLLNTHHFAPDVAVWTNLYDNHLDYHGTLDHYKNAKKNICLHQHKNQIAILHANLAPDCQNIPSNIHWICVNQEQAIQMQNKNPQHYSWFIDEQEIITMLHSSKTTSFFNINQLPTLTFKENWIMLCVILYTQKLDIYSMPIHTNNLTLPAHRLHALATIKNKTFYNDSKSTLWQATYKALQTLPQIPTIIFVGGLSKGVDRTPFFALLNLKLHIVYIFGKEADQLQVLCDTYSIPYKKFDTLEQAFNACIQEPFACNILFSPGGASYDLFENFEHRGNRFEFLVNSYQNMIKENKIISN